MIRKANIYLWIMAILIIPTLQAYQAEAFEHEPSSSTEHEQTARSENEFERTKDIRDHSWAFDPEKPDHLQNSSKTVLPEKTGFKRIQQQLSDWWSNLFGDGNTVSKGLESYREKISKANKANNDEIRKSGTSTINVDNIKALDAKASESFKKLNPKQQLESLNSWVATEKSALDVAQKDQISKSKATMLEAEKSINEHQKEIRKIQKDDVKQFNGIRDLINSKIPKFDSTTLSPEEETLFKQLKNNQQAAVLSPENRQPLQDLIDTLLTNQAESLGELGRKTLQQFANKLTENNTQRETLERNVSDLDQAAKKENYQNHLNIQKEFNRRLNNLVNQIQPLVAGDGSILKYNIKTGSFEYHSPKEAPAFTEPTFQEPTEFSPHNLNAERYAQLDRDQKNDTIEQALDNYDQLTPKDKMVLQLRMKNDSELPDYLRARFNEIKTQQPRIQTEPTGYESDNSQPSSPKQKELDYDLMLKNFEETGTQGNWNS